MSMQIQNIRKTVEARNICNAGMFVVRGFSVNICGTMVYLRTHCTLIQIDCFNKRYIGR
jgi:hypothetical protein